MRQRTPLTPRRLRRWYRNYNQRYFNNQLPPRITLKLHGDHGFRGYLNHGSCPEGCSLAIHEAYYWDTGIARMTMIHEMVHLYLFPYIGHGPRFQKEMLRLARMGAFRVLW